MIRVTCAIIESNGEILITQRSASMSQPLLWEFPGGKIEAGESEEECLKREIREELNLHINCQHMLSPNTYTYPNKTVELIPYVCSITGGEISLLEHVAFEWVSMEELRQYEWCPADLPVITTYIHFKTSQG